MTIWDALEEQFHADVTILAGTDDGAGHYWGLPLEEVDEDNDGFLEDDAEEMWWAAGVCGQPS